MTQRKLARLRRKYYNRSIVCYSLAGVMLIVSIIFFVKFAGEASSYYECDKLYKEAIENYVTVAEIPSNTIAEDESSQWYNSISVNIKSLELINPEVKGWIYFENEDISYPVLYSGDNTKYLKTSYDGQRASAGSIFLDQGNSGSFDDQYIIMYGHNMKDKSMFGKLRLYNQSDYYDDHKYFQIYTDDGVYRYMVFACKDVSKFDQLYEPHRMAEPDFREFVLKHIAAGSKIDTAVLPNDSDHVITLSTCSTPNHRLIVSAIRIDEHSAKDIYSEAKQ